MAFWRLKTKPLFSYDSGRLRSNHAIGMHIQKHLWMAICFFIITALIALVESKNPVSVVEGVTGGPAKLQCKVSQRKQGEEPILIFWYKGNKRYPFFTLDLRDGSPRDFIGSKMEKRVKSDETGEWLTIRPLLASDSAQYKCKVDYDNSPSLEALVNLTVYDPPSKLILQDEQEKAITGPVYGPVTEDVGIKLYCIAIGGVPQPTVTWWNGPEKLNNRILKIGTSIASQEEGMMPISKYGRVGHSLGMIGGDNSPRVVAELSIPRVGRSHAGANLSCKAQNNKLTKSLTKTVTLSVYLRPSSVKIISPKDDFKEDVEIRLTCETTGSDPPAKIIWEKTTQSQTVTLESKSGVTDGKTTSWLKFTPSAKDHGSTLTCKAHNPEIPGNKDGKYKETSTKLRVKFLPRVKLELGRNLDKKTVKEGDDVYFTCEIFSNPRARSISWHLNGKQIEQNLTAGVLESGEDLVLQRIHRGYAGNYTCTATNEIGTRQSSVFQLPVKFLPVCAKKRTVVSVKESESIILTCKVEALPSDDLHFFWYFNNTLDTVDVESGRVTVDGTTSYLEYTPLTPRDYGMLSCWASNEVGMQAEPCRFTVTEAGPPEIVRNCVLVNHTVGALEVSCSPGNDGGSKQRFVAKVFASPSHTLTSVLRNSTPNFNVIGLIPGQDYLISITAENDKGSSEPEEIDAIRLKVAEKRMGDVKAAPVSPLVGVFLGLVGGFILLLLLGLILSKARSNRSSCWRRSMNGAMSSTDKSQSDRIVIDDNAFQKSPSVTQTHVHPPSIGRAQLQDEEEEDGPDLVKSSNETSQLLDSRKCPDMITRRHTSYVAGLAKPQPASSNSSPITQSPCIVPRGSFLDPQSPLHLPGDESFV